MMTVGVLVLMQILAVCVNSKNIAISTTTTTEPPPPRPYAFGYAAGRAPGHIDRTHSEISDGSGTVQGSYSYVDPSNKIRTVDYVADKQGFHPVLNFEPTDTKAVALAKDKHHALYAQIAANHQAGTREETLPRETNAVAAARADHLARFASVARLEPGTVIVPQQTRAVNQAINKHLDMFARIAEDHARIQAEHKALGAAEELEQGRLLEI